MNQLHVSRSNNWQCCSEQRRKRFLYHLQRRANNFFLRPVSWKPSTTEKIKSTIRWYN